MTNTVSLMKNRPWGFVVILALYLSLATFYNISIPVFESPDELQHAAFVVWLADEGSLPVVNPEELGPWEQEGTQPPLYYWLSATLVGGLSHDRADSLAALNPHANVGEPLRPDNKNRVLHDMERERWPYQGTVLFVHLVRAVSTLMAVGTLWAIYRLGRITFPDQAGVALGMMGLVAFTPQFIFLSSSVSNDNAVILVASWTLVLLAGWLRAPQLPGWLQLGAMGALLGLGVLAKLSGLLLWPLAAGAIVWLAWRSRDLRWLIRASLVVFGVALVLSGWWFVRNHHLYGDLSGLGPHLEVMAGHRQHLPSGARAIRAEFRGLRYSFWALFGWFNILAPDVFYLIVDGLTVLGAIGFGIFLVHSLRHYPRSTREIVSMLIAWFCLVSVGLLQWSMPTAASQGRLLFPAWPAVALFLVVGWAELVPRRLRQPLGIVALVGWATCAALCAAFVLRPAYALPERARTLDELTIVPSDLHVRYGDCCELVGYVAPDQPLHPGDRVPLTLVWQVLEPIDQNYSLFVHARTADGQLAGQLDTFHGSGMYPTSQWHPGEIIADTVYVPISWEADTPGLIRFHVGLYELATMEGVPAFSSDAVKLKTVVAGEAALAPFQWPQPQLDVVASTVFEQKIRLSGIDLSQDDVIHPGDVVTVTLQWEALDRITEDFTGFIHLVDISGNDVAQDDHPPLNGRYPTRLWLTGTVVYDPYRLALPDDLSEGRYDLWGGFYRPESGQRLQAISPETGERWRDDLVYVGTLMVTTSDK